MFKRNRPSKFSKELEDKIQHACTILHASSSPNICAVATKHKVPYDTLHRQYLGQSQSYHKAHIKQQLLSPESETVLVDWIKLLSSMGQPLSKCIIQSKAAALCHGKSKPHEKWVRGFLKCHPDICLGKPSALDPKWCQSFNCTVVNHHFELLKKLLDKKGIPWKNIYNMDEKGCQRGGGRKASPEKYFVPHGRYPKYKI